VNFVKENLVDEVNFVNVNFFEEASFDEEANSSCRAIGTTTACTAMAV
jgi:hypothetical protein